MNRFSPCLAAVAVVAFLGGPGRAADADALKGSYSITDSGMKITLTFDGAGAFTVKLKDDVAVEGTYKVDKDTVEITDKKGPAAITDKGPGKYKFAIDKDKKTLTFTKVSDEAAGRATALTGMPWKAE
ncbi:MAG TPA: hypothetical protein VMS17_10095 [Gemmataceae bacterium]|nr:hypothetical protein [Gemmataceae bacterium]